MNAHDSWKVSSYFPIITRYDGRAVHLSKCTYEEIRQHIPRQTAITLIAEEGTAGHE